MDSNQIAIFEKKALSCSDVESLLDDYLAGNLKLSLRDRIATHLSRCDGCSSMVRDMRQILAVASTLNDQPMRPEIQLRLREKLREAVNHHVPMPRRPQLSVVK